MATDRKPPRGGNQRNDGKKGSKSSFRGKGKGYSYDSRNSGGRPGGKKYYRDDNRRPEDGPSREMRSDDRDEGGNKSDDRSRGSYRGKESRGRDNRREGGYKSRDDRGGSYRGKDSRGRDDRREGGYKSRDDRGGSYRGKDSRGRDDRREGGYKSRDDRGGSHRGKDSRGRDDRREGGYKSRDNRGGSQRGKDSRSSYGRPGDKRGNQPRKHEDGGRKRYSVIEGKDKPRRITTSVREPEEVMRLNKYLAHAGIAARRKADEIIAAGEIMVNGKVITELGTKVRPGEDVIKYRGNEVTFENQLIYILLNKPKDTITTVDDEKNRRTVMELIPTLNRVFPVGRLDRNTTGVLLLTNDGDLAYALMHPKFEVEKAYIAEIDRKISSADVDKLKNGIRLEDGMTAQCDVEVIDPPYGQTVGIVLHEGRNRQVRRMFEALNYDVRKLERIQYAGLTSAGLKRGGWRYLDEHEVKHLHKLTKEFKPESSQ